MNVQLVKQIIIYKMVDAIKILLKELLIVKHIKMLMNVSDVNKVCFYKLLILVLMWLK